MDFDRTFTSKQLLNNFIEYTKVVDCCCICFQFNVLYINQAVGFLVWIFVHFSQSGSLLAMWYGFFFSLLKIIRWLFVAFFYDIWCLMKWCVFSWESYKFQNILLKIIIFNTKYYRNVHSSCECGNFCYFFRNFLDNALPKFNPATTKQHYLLIKIYIYNYTIDKTF